jgi:large subunit ribosomal protein L18
VKHQRAKLRQQQRRRWRVRSKLSGTLAQPRLTVHRSNQHIYCQLVDDVNGKTLASASTRDKQIRDGLKYGGNQDAATAVGRAIAERAKDAGVEAVTFDRGSYKYHGRVAALANAAREAGLKF